MPFKSTAQRGYLFAKHPDVAKKFAAETPKGASLPEHAPKKAGGIHTGRISAMFKKKGK